MADQNVAAISQLLTRAHYSGPGPVRNDSTYHNISQYSTMLNGVDQDTNYRLRDAQWFSLGALGVLILTLRIVYRFKAHMRHLAALGLTGPQQRYWAMNRGNWWWMKKHILYAPLKNKRHNRTMHASKLDMGCIPSRFHTMLIFAYTATNLAYCAHLNYKKPNHYAVMAELRGRTGVMAVINMIALIIFAGRNNPLISLLQISFDTYNLMHRWIGRMVAIQSIVHTCAWFYVKVAGDGWEGVWESMSQDPFIGWGMVGTGAMILIFVLTPSPIRHAFYETFLNIHIILAVVAVVTIYLHCKIDDLPQLPDIQAIGFLWLGDRLARLYLLFRNNYSRQGWTKATVEALPGEACRVTMHLPNRVDIKPGTHAYLRFGGINAWESHPFSIAWVEHLPRKGGLPITEKPMSSTEPKIRRSDTVTDVSFVIQAQGGLTRRLFNTAQACSPRVWTVKAAMEGPYAGHHSMDSYGHCVLFAGASGITHQIPFIRHLVTGYANGTVAARKVTLIWVVRDSEQLEWVRPWMDTILKLPGRRDILNIKLFITRPKNPREIVSPSSTVMMFPTRPKVTFLLEEEVKHQTGAMCVTVCGPGGLADSVREAVRHVQEDGNVDFIEESFTW